MTAKLENLLIYKTIFFPQNDLTIKARNVKKKVFE